MLAAQKRAAPAAGAPQARRRLPGRLPEPGAHQRCPCCCSPLQYRILREKGTEMAGTGQYNKHYEEGTYVCAGCGTPLYK